MQSGFIGGYYRDPSRPLLPPALLLRTPRPSGRPRESPDLERETAARFSRHVLSPTADVAVRRARDARRREECEKPRIPPRAFVAGESGSVGRSPPPPRPHPG